MLERCAFFKTCAFRNLFVQNGFGKLEFGNLSVGNCAFQKLEDVETYLYDVRCQNLSFENLSFEKCDVGHQPSPVKGEFSYL